MVKRTTRPKLSGWLVLVLGLATAWCAAAGDLHPDDLRGSFPVSFERTVSEAGALPSDSGTILPPVELRSILLILHLLGLCLGLGTAISLDLTCLRWVRSGIVPPGAGEALKQGERMVLIGFALLWASGIALVALHPGHLGNPKVWAKLVVVSALTLNAVLLHRRVLPVFGASLGRPLDGGWRSGERDLFVLCGAVSAASWSMAFALGVLREWNNVVAAGPILLLWLLAVAGAYVAGTTLFPRPASARGRDVYQGTERRRGRLAR